MDVLILQPPIVQLNTAYPSGAYLSAFFKQTEFSDVVESVKWLDLSIELFYEIFSPSGLLRLFDLCEKKALKMADEAQKRGDEATAFNLRRYVGEKKNWISWIETITSILRGDKSGFENAHRFVFGAHVPRGSRMENFLESLDHDLTTDDARALASFALADLADFITAVFDKNFSLVRYAEALTVSESTFEQVEKGADSPILEEFFDSVLKRALKNYLSKKDEGQKSKTLVLISVPFAGTFAAALYAGRFIKNNFFGDAYVCFGGGFINTELRETKEKNLSKYCDALCYDRGYASYKNLLNQFKASGDFDVREPVYKLRKFSSLGTVEPCEAESEVLLYEKKQTASIIPDFSDIDFGRYPRLIDDKNPMHRLWSDGSWIKIYMAHGCYWHKCSFCDVTLDYVCGYCPTNVKRLYDEILRQCEEKNVYGIHFVDEAMPPALMIDFARENIAHGSPLTWWGNVRFEKVFTRDVADFLAAGGLIGVSAGLESATGNGLSAIHKGTDLESIVGACCAFKEAGILVHAYMIYGYWWETPQDLINSMETLRQFYANGLLDSSFWHKFVLTRHSRVYKDWQEGLVSDLKPLAEKNIPLFAKNGLHFEGEKKSEKYGRFLDYSLNQWMHGEDLEKPAQKWFDFPVPKPNVGHDFIAKLIAKYESKRDSEFKKPFSPEKKIWLGGEKFLLNGGKKIGWFYMGEYFELPANAPESAFRGKGLCVI
ncbi:B12-binding domain-containing radical SAM protein [Treponema zioleckii]|uniref:B12-binding domain-containing radical SAM protein n=1 Tax=Treponema zioleckii TaxID=331680 RepID=UPI00168C0C98|nr:radical SAM protein [Treponema zioleckii]